MGVVVGNGLLVEDLPVMAFCELLAGHRLAVG
jgi:hypothetical protein